MVLFVKIITMMMMVVLEVVVMMLMMTTTMTTMTTTMVTTMTTMMTTMIMTMTLTATMTMTKQCPCSRIVAAAPTIRYLLENEAKAVFLISHLGCPNGQRNEKFSLKVIVEELQKILDR